VPKHSGREERVIVLRYDPRRRNFIATLLLVSLSLMLASAFLAGRHIATTERTEALNERDQLEEKWVNREEDLTLLQQQLANLKLGTEIDKAATEQVRHELNSLRNSIAGLEEEIAFYRSLMDPDAEKKGLDVRSFAVFHRQLDGPFEFKLIIQQLGPNHPLIKGHVSLDIVGQLNGEAKVWSVSKLSEQYNADRIKLRFRYFQNISGELTLPDGFVPQQVRIVATAQTNKQQPVEKSFDWIIEKV